MSLRRRPGTGGWSGSGASDEAMAVAVEPALRVAGLLRRLRDEARLTQEELATPAGLAVRSVSDLERGVHPTARKDTAGLLADALNVTGSVRELFVAAARGRAPASEALAAWDRAPRGAGTEVASLDGHVPSWPASAAHTCERKSACAFEPVTSRAGTCCQA
jgi:transcriptional regulator with XRE-family HTH domain